MARTAKTSKKRAQQLKHDKFRDTTMGAFDHLGNRLEGRGRTILYALAGLVVLAALFGLYRTWSAGRAEKASLALGKAIEIGNAEITTGPPAPGQTGLTFPSERERAQKALEEFQRVAAEHGDPYREMARYFAATNLLVVERAKGLGELESLTRSGNDEVAARSKFALAQAKEADGDNDRAFALYNELLKDKSTIIPPDTVNLRIASVLERQGKRDEAAEILFRLVEEARKTKDKNGKPLPATATVREAADKLEKLNPERYKQLTPQATAADLSI